MKINRDKDIAIFETLFALEKMVLFKPYLINSATFIKLAENLYCHNSIGLILTL